MFYIFWVLVIPFIVGVAVGIVAWKVSDDGEAGFAGFVVAGLICLCVMLPGSSVLWHNQVEVPSIQEKIITVDSWAPKTGIHYNENGVMEISNADQLMLTTKDGEQFINEENFLFNKFATRELFHQLRVNGTYKVRYYGWREGYKSGFPNLLSVVEVIDENNTKPIRDADYFGAKLVIGQNNLYTDQQ